MSSLNLNRFCSTKQNGLPPLPLRFGTLNSYWLTIGRMRWRRRNRSCWLGSTATSVRAAASAGACWSGSPSGSELVDCIGVESEDEANVRENVAMTVLKRVIRCLDVDKGRVVKGTNFVGLRDAGDPVELAERYDAEGADELVFLDITASHEARANIVNLARRTADNVFIPFTIGGGIRSREDAQAVLDAGADKVSVNSAAVMRPELMSELADMFGAQCVVLAID